MYRVTPTVQDLEVNINKLIADIKTININKASGPDGISSRGLAIAGSSALEGIVTVFKNSMTQAPFTRVRTNFCTDKNLHGSTLRSHGTGGTGRIF